MDEKLTQLQQLCLDTQDFEFQQRLEHIAKFFLTTSYGAWLDGSSFESLDDFNYKLDRLDCVTFVEVVLALAKTNPTQDLKIFVQNFENLLQKIHYANAHPNFLSRNHFFCVDWIVNNKYLAEDITASLTPNYKIATALIDKPRWFKGHKVNQTSDNLLHLNVLDKLTAETSNIPYMELSEILNNYNNYVASFPSYSIVCIVRPDWNLAETIGTNLNISHLGLAFKKENKLVFYHSTIIQNQIVCEPLDEYLQRHVNSPTIKGISVLAISPGYYNAG